MDYDNDGFLDLFLTVGNTSGSTNLHNLIYRNNGDGKFSAVTNNALVQDSGNYAGSAWADYDNDGNIDVLVFDLPHNYLYHNNGDGTFARITTGSIASDPTSNNSSCAWGDYDNDGYLDLFAANANGQNSFLYHNNGDGTFTRITNDIVATDRGHNSLGCAWGDYDNDGFLDLLVANEGGPDVVPTVVNVLYHNNGDGTFTKVTTGSPVNEYSDSWGCAWGDYDNDGFLDLFASRGDGRGNYLYRNNGNSNSWLAVKLVGMISNRAAIGARVRAQAFYRGANRRQLRQISGGGSFDGNNDLRANFGFGDATNIDAVRIEWPSGLVQTLTNVVPKQFLTVIEHQENAGGTILISGAERLTNGAVKLSVTGNPGLLYLFEASTDLVSWTKLGVRTNLTGAVEFSDSTAAKLNRRFYRVSAP